VSDPLAAVPEGERALLRRAAIPPRVGAMKAVLTDARFSDPAWIFERKLDGIRCIATKERGRVRLVSRNDLSLNARFPEVVAALEADPGDGFVVDGEIVAFAGANTSFAKLARRGHERVRVFLYAFDVLFAAGHDVRPLPLRTRKAVLRRTLDFGRAGAVRLTPHRRRDGELLYEEACRKAGRA
jgi:bifunctional non-homologous end joining protein LigD